MVQREQQPELTELVEVHAVGDRREVVAGVLTGRHRRLHLREERVVLQDHLVEVDLDAGLRGELVKGGVIALALPHVHVVRPMRPTDLTGLGLVLPVRLDLSLQRRTGRLGLALAADAAGRERRRTRAHSDQPQEVTPINPRAPTAFYGHVLSSGGSNSWYPLLVGQLTHVWSPRCGAAARSPALSW